MQVRSLESDRSHARAGSSTGGTDIVALVLNKWFHIPVAGLLYVIDFLVLWGQVFFLIRSKLRTEC